jgi:predicted metal-binding protein
MLPMIESRNPLRLYPTPWKGEAIFACRKCQRRMKKHGGPDALRRLKKWFKRRARSTPEASAVSVIEVSCLKLCPKGGVTVFSGRHLGGELGVSIARSEDDLERLYCELTEVALSPENATLT